MYVCVLLCFGLFVLYMYFILVVFLMVFQFLMGYLMPIFDSFVNDYSHNYIFNF